MSLPILSEFRRKLVGRLLTIVESSFSDSDQREACKSLVRQAVSLSLSELEIELRGQVT